MCGGIKRSASDDPNVRTDHCEDGLIIEIDSKSAYGTFDVHSKASFFGFVVEYHYPSVLTKMVVMSNAKMVRMTMNKIGFLTEIDKKSAFGTLTVNN